MTSNGTDVHKYRDMIVAEIEEALDPKTWDDPSDRDDGAEDLFEWFEGWALSLDVWRKEHAPDEVKAEILLTCGGPTVRIEYDSRWNGATLYHSWGERRIGDLVEECHEAEIHGDVIERLFDALGVTAETV